MGIGSGVGDSNFAVRVVKGVEGLDVGEEEGLKKRGEARVFVSTGTRVGEGKVIGDEV